MKVSPVQQLSYKNVYNNKPVKTGANNTCVSTSPAFKGGQNPFPYLDSALYIFQMDKLKKETEQFPQDIEYRTNLLKNAGLNPLSQHKLRAIIGPQEIKNILQNYDSKPDLYSVGRDDKNLINRTMRANIHIHTIASDGSLTVTEVLDKAAEYANKVKTDFPKETEPFVIAITDHDTTDGAKEAIKVISEKPLKYKNLRVILGAEITTFDNIAPEIAGAPSNTHVLVYGIDPNEKIFDNFIEMTKQKKLQIEEKMTDSANKIYKKHFGTDNFFSTLGAKEQYNAINKNILGIYNGMSKYVETKAVVEQIVLKDKQIDKTLKKHNLPTDVDGFMTKLSEFHASRDGNNKVKKAVETIPEFIAAMTNSEVDSNWEQTKNHVTKIISEGMEKPEFAEYTKDMKASLGEYKVTLQPKYNYMPTFEVLNYNLAKQPNTLVGIAHPVDNVKKIENDAHKYSYLDKFFNKFRSIYKEKTIFTEAYYQSYCGEKERFNSADKTKKYFKKVSKLLNIIKTGSLDSHGTSVFRRL